VWVCVYIYISLYLWVLLQHDVSQWRIVFYIASGVFFTFNLFFVLFGKAEIQPWNDTDAQSKWMQPTMYIIIPVRMQAIFVKQHKYISLSLPQTFSQKHHTTPLWLSENGQEYFQFSNFV